MPVLCCLLTPGNGEEPQWTSLCSELIPWPTRGFHILQHWLAVGVVVFMVWFIRLLHHALAIKGKLRFSCTLIEGGFSSLPAMKFLFEDIAILFISTSQNNGRYRRLGQTSPRLSQPSPNLPFVIQGLEPGNHQQIYPVCTYPFFPLPILTFRLHSILWQAVESSLVLNPPHCSFNVS